MSVDSALTGFDHLPPDVAAAIAAASKAEVVELGWRFPRAIYDIPRLNWDEMNGKRAPAALLYGVPQSDLKILRSVHPILRDGIPCRAIAFIAADERTRLFVSRRIVGLIVGHGAAFETIRLHEDANEGRNGVVVLTITIPEAQRAKIENLLLAVIENDDALQRMLLRSGMAADRITLDRSLIADFLRRGGGITRHFKGPRSRRYRFSDFRLDDQVNFGLGVQQTLVFDDHEVLEFALQKFEEFKDSFTQRRNEALTIRLVTPTHDGAGGANTDLLFANDSITLIADINRAATRRQVVFFLEMVCGFDGIEAPAVTSLSEDEADRGVTLPWA